MARINNKIRQAMERRGKRFRRSQRLLKDLPTKEGGTLEVGGLHFVREGNVWRLYDPDHPPSGGGRRGYLHGLGSFFEYVGIGGICPDEFVHGYTMHGMGSDYAL